MIGHKLLKTAVHFSYTYSYLEQIEAHRLVGKEIPKAALNCSTLNTTTFRTSTNGRATEKLLRTVRPSRVIIIFLSSIRCIVHSPSLYSMHCVDRSPMTDRDSVKLAHHLCQYFSATFRRGQEMPSMRTHAMAHGSRNGQTRSPILHMPTCTYNMYVICRHCDCMWGSTRCLYLKLFWFADLHFFSRATFFEPKILFGKKYLFHV